MPAMATNTYAASKLKVKASKKTVQVKKSVKLTAKGLSAKQLKKVKWSTTKAGKKVVKLSKKKGKSIKVTGKKAGKAKITAKYGKKKATITIKVKAVKKTPATPAKSAPVISGTENVQTQYGLATTYNKVTKELTKADLLKGVTASVDGQAIALTEENVTIGDPIYDYIDKSAETKDGRLVKQAMYPVTYTVTANDKTTTKTIYVVVKNQDPTLNAKDVAYAINKTKEDNNEITLRGIVEKAVVSVDDYESFPATATDKSLSAFEKISGNTVSVYKIVNAEGKTVYAVEDAAANQKEVKLDAKNFRTAEATTYTVTLKATDYLTGTSTKDIKLNIQPNQAPTVTTEAVTLYTDYNGFSEATAREDILSQLTYDDAEDGTGVAVASNNGFVEFEDADTNKIAFDKSKVAYVYVTKVLDKDGSSAQGKRIAVTKKVSTPAITVKDDQGKGTTGRVYLPYVGENTHQAKYGISDFNAYISAKAGDQDLTLSTAAYDAAEEGAWLANNNGNASLDPREEGAATIDYTVYYNVKVGDNMRHFQATKKVIFKVVKDENLAATKALDAKTDKGTIPAPTTGTAVKDDGSQDTNPAKAEVKVTIALSADKTTADATVTGTTEAVQYHWQFETADGTYQDFERTSASTASLELNGYKGTIRVAINDGSFNNGNPVYSDPIVIK